MQLWEHKLLESGALANSSQHDRKTEEAVSENSLLSRNSTLFHRHSMIASVATPLFCCLGVILSALNLSVGRAHIVNTLLTSSRWSLPTGSTFNRTG